MGVDRLLHLVRALAAAPAVPLRGHPRPHSRVRLTLPSVDIDVGTELVCRIRKLAHGIGFGGLYPHGDEYLVARTD
ncbi:phosphoribosylformylglycinamidine cyclo-ligase, chloroplastic [Hordeum vulgare]|nr:phosphoribosylformylglycinamidine cyclo-ligase, chloroplastic [Hordeum vulgare]